MSTNVHCLMLKYKCLKDLCWDHGQAQILCNTTSKFQRYSLNLILTIQGSRYANRLVHFLLADLITFFLLYKYAVLASRMCISFYFISDRNKSLVFSRQIDFLLPRAGDQRHLLFTSWCSWAPMVSKLSPYSPRGVHGRPWLVDSPCKTNPENCIFSQF